MRRIGTAVGVLLAAFAAARCGGSDSSGPCTGNACESLDGGFNDGEVGAVVPPNCDLTKSIEDSPGCVDNALGVFVTPTGRTGAAGTKEDPLAAIGEAVEKAAASGKPRVYVCEGTYTSAVVVKQPVAIFGGLTCAWQPTTTRVRLTPDRGIALRIEKVSGAVLVEDIDVVGLADASRAGESAIGVFVSESTNVVFRRAAISARAGTPGAPGGTASNHAGTPAKRGSNAFGSAGGAATTCACLDGSTSSTGARGGTVVAGVLDPGSGSSVPPVGAINEGGNGANQCVAGTPGADGLGAAGGKGTTVAGVLTASGWSSVTPLAKASPGNPGQGGGGGGGISTVGQGGAGGGCGGCGGGGGAPGGNGGSSFALLVFNAKVIVESSTLTSSTGGFGGRGGDGQDGQPGGTTGMSTTCAGGTGGAGAGGSAGGGGAGGHSAGVAYVGEAPRLDNSTANPGPNGRKGEPGTPGGGPGNAGGAGEAGADGQMTSTLELQ